MGYFKNKNIEQIELEEKCIEALELGARSDEDVYLYVASYAKNKPTLNDVSFVMDSIASRVGYEER